MRPVLESGQVLQGAQVSDFELRLAGVTGRTHAISCGSGTDALLLALAALQLPAGSRVAVPSFTFVASASPIL
jgi:UDP-2-acetamido-2-deoxy-ribo-hexuluronate aminotransferase